MLRGETSKTSQLSRFWEESNLNSRGNPFGFQKEFVFRIPKCGIMSLCLID